MAIYIFKSSDAGSPTLSNVAGELITLLDALLVNGYNTKTITITRSGTVATATCTTHGFVTGQRVVVSGADQTDYNIEARITVTDANTFTYVVANNPATPATGTISAKVAPLGWTKSYSGTNLAAYRQKAGTNQFYMRIDDTNTTYARGVGYETMSDVNTGTNAFPTEAQATGGLYLPKSTAAANRTWFMYSNGKILYFMVRNDGTYYNGFCFGDFASFSPGDAYNTIFIGGSATNEFKQLWSVSSLPPNLSADVRHSVVRDHTGASGAVAHSKVVYSPCYTTNWSPTNYPVGGEGLTIHAFTYPMTIVGGLSMTRVTLFPNTQTQGPRGRLPGFWALNHKRQLAHLDTFSGNAELDGRTFEVISLVGDSNYYGQAVFETSDTWD